MEVKLMPQAEEDLAYWKSTGNKRIMKRITKLLDDILLHPFTGIGKPEPLKGDLQGVWSRRITDEHRLLYSVSNGMIYVYVLSLRFHYSNIYTPCPSNRSVGIFVEDWCSPSSSLVSNSNSFSLRLGSTF